MELLSDGEIQLSSIKDYRQWEVLLESCRETIEARKAFRFPGTRRACADLMDAIMQHARRQQRARPPRCWLPIIRKLRENDGPVLIESREPEQPKPSWVRIKADRSLEVLPEGILREAFSALNEARGADSRLLADLEPTLIERARQHGVPMDWDTGTTWLDQLMAERPDLAARLNGPRERLAALRTLA